jgi:hypothetical protein
MRYHVTHSPHQCPADQGAPSARAKQHATHATPLCRHAEGSESPAFLALFPGGVAVQPGGVAAGLRSAKDSSGPELHRLTGSRRLRAAQVQPTGDGLLEDAVCVLDLRGGGDQVIQWVGKAATRALKYQALSYASQLEETNHGGDAEVRARWRLARLVPLEFRTSPHARAVSIPP